MAALQALSSEKGALMQKVRNLDQVAKREAARRVRAAAADDDDDGGGGLSDLESGGGGGGGFEAAAPMVSYSVGGLRLRGTAHVPQILRFVRISKPERSN